MAQGVLVVTEIAAGKPAPLVYELIGLARRLGRPVSTVLLGSAVAHLAGELFTHGADRVFLGEEDALADYEPERWTAYLAQAARAAQPALILVPHTALGADLAPRVAFRLGTTVATACEDIAENGARLLFTRACYGGNVRESLSFRTVPAVATVRAGVFEAPARESGRNGELLRIELAAGTPASRLKVIARERTAGGAMRLEEARVVVAGGRGLEGPEGFVLLGELAEVLGGAVGASRVPCDLGWCPHSMQIGLTGRTVTPELYIAVGISGAGHHMAGCGSARNIVAINTDREAAIYRQARWGVVGDYRQVIPPLIAAIRAIQSAERQGE